MAASFGRPDDNVRGSTGVVGWIHLPPSSASEIVVPAPIAGVVPARTANLGQVVGMGQELFVVTDGCAAEVVPGLRAGSPDMVLAGSKGTCPIGGARLWWLDVGLIGMLPAKP